MVAISSVQRCDFEPFDAVCNASIEYIAPTHNVDLMGEFPVRWRLHGRYIDYDIRALTDDNFVWTLAAKIHGGKATVQRKARCLCYICDYDDQGVV